MTHLALEKLLPVCDVLVLKALETAGKRIVRINRSRYNELGGRYLHSAHTLWPDVDDTVSKALKGAWDILPLVVERWAEDVDVECLMNHLDSYVHDLVITGTDHTVGELEYRVKSCLL